MLGSIKAATIVLFTVVSASAALAQSDSWSQWSLGLAGQYDLVNHSWSPNFNFELSLTDRFFCGKVDSKTPYSSNNNLISCQPVALFSFGFSNVGNYLHYVLSNPDDGDPDSLCNQLQFYGGAGLGMQFNFGPRNPISLTVGYGADFEPTRAPHGVAYLGLAFGFNGS